MRKHLVPAVALTLAVGALAAAAPAHAAEADCPNGGVVRFGVEPYESAQRWCRSTTTSPS